MFLVLVPPQPTKWVRSFYPYHLLIPKFDAVAPMVYWGRRNASQSVSFAVTWLSRYGRPVAPIGQAYDMGPEGGPKGHPKGKALVNIPPGGLKKIEAPAAVVEGNRQRLGPPGLRHHQHGAPGWRLDHDHVAHEARLLAVDSFFPRGINAPKDNDPTFGKGAVEGVLSAAPGGVERLMRIGAPADEIVRAAKERAATSGRRIIDELEELVGHQPALGGPPQLPADLVLQKLAPLFADPEVAKIAHNGKFDLAHLASKVKLIHRRDSLRAEKVLQERLFNHPSIEVVWDTAVEEVEGTEDPKGVTGIVIAQPMPAHLDAPTVLTLIDPAKDVDVSVHNGMLHIKAERREEEKTDEKGYVRRELRYGSFTRTLPLPEGVSTDDVTAYRLLLELPADVQARNAQLQAQIDELQRFADLDAELRAKREALVTVMAGDVSWPTLLTEIAMVIPGEVWLETIVASAGETVGATPVGTETAAVRIAQEAAFGRIQFSGRAVSMPGVARWLIRLATVNEFQAIWLNSAVAEDIPEGVGVVDFDSTLEFDDGAGSERFQQFGEGL